MIKVAIAGLGGKGGTSSQAIKKYLRENFDVAIEKKASSIRNALNSGVDKGHLIRTKGKGAAGAFKLDTTKEKAVAKAKAAKEKERMKARKEREKRAEKAKKDKTAKKEKAKTAKLATTKKTVHKKTPKKPAKKTPKSTKHPPQKSRSKPAQKTSERKWQLKRQKYETQNNAK